MQNVYAFVTYETRNTPCGGIAAVITHLPAEINRLSKIPTLIITPYHHKLMKKNDVKTKIHSDFEIEFGSDVQKIDVRIKTDEKIPLYFLKPENPDFFSGFPHPYYPSYNLKRDVLLFGSAVARFISILNSESDEEQSLSDWTLFLQEWEAASVALAFSGVVERPKMILTMHNSYDSGGLPGTALSSANINPDNCPGPDGIRSATIMQRAIPLLHKPLLTVSRQFALDYFNDSLQYAVLAPHLQELLRDNVHGIDNGAFREISIEKKYLTSNVEKNLGQFRAWKNQKRITAIKTLEKFVKKEKREVWGDLQLVKVDDLPWFILAGRDDPRQKGYDVAVSAITNFLEKGGDAYFFFFPILGDEGIDGLSFLKELGEKFPDKVTAFPIRFDAGYFPTLEASTYGIMPSFYEPFGMANEFYYSGTVAMGRATGGLIQQIVPLRSIKSFNLAVNRLTEPWYDYDTPPSGILFREDDNIESRTDDWRWMNSARYQIGGDHPNRIELRSNCTLFKSMVNSLEDAINDAIDVYRHQPELYYKMLLNGINHIQTNFSWKKTALEYIEIASNLD